MLYNTTKNNDCLVYLLIFEQKIKTYFIMKTLNESLEKLMKVKHADDTKSSYAFRLFHISLIEKYGDDFKLKLTDEEFDKLYELKELSIKERKERDYKTKSNIFSFKS